MLYEIPFFALSLTVTLCRLLFQRAKPRRFNSQVQYDSMGSSYGAIGLTIFFQQAGVWSPMLDELERLVKELIRLVGNAAV